MDITAVSSTREKDPPLGIDQESDKSPPQSTDNSQDSNDHWGHINSSEFRMRAVSCPSKPDISKKLSFGHLYSLYSPKKEEPNLSVQIADYNRKHDSWLELTLNQEDQVYSGLLQFQYFNGNEMRTDNVLVKNSDSIAELIPILKATFIPDEPEGRSDENHSYVALVQGEMERELDMNDKPLEIALDCSSKGLASPKFLFKCPLSELTDTPILGRQTNRFTSYVGSLALPSGSENEGSPTMNRHLQVLNKEYDQDQKSIASFGSALSLSSKSSKTKSTSSLVVKSKKKKLTHTLSNQETGSSNKGDIHVLEPSPAHHRSQTHINSPVSRRKNGRPKSIMTNFISRSLRIRKKHKHSISDTTSNSPAEYSSNHSQETAEDMLQVNSLVSPLPAERRFTMTTVMHIYYMKPKQVQLYKSILVSEKSTTKQVITQSLERYNMKYCNPDDFGLYEVIGKWQEISGTLPSKANLNVSSSSNGGSSSTLPNKYGTSPLVNRRTAVEEFVVCYSRELNHDDCPYSSQYFLETKEGYTRRFELRQKPSKDSEESRKGSTISALAIESTRENSDPVADCRSVSMAHINCNPEESPVILGNTSHRKRARRNRIRELSSSPTELSDTLKKNDCSTPPSIIKDQNQKSISVLSCSSSDNEVSNQDVCPPVPSNEIISYDTPFLLNLHICEPKKEKLVYLLKEKSTHIISKSSYKASEDNATEIIICQPDVKDSTSICSICNRSVSDSTNFEINAGSTLVPVMINGQIIQQQSPLIHGDIISIGKIHIFLFQNFKHQTLTYNWKPEQIETSNLGDARPSSQLSVSSVSTNGETNGKLTIVSGTLNSNSRSASEFSLTVQDVDSHTLTAISLGKLSISESPSMTDKSTKHEKPISQSKHDAHARLIIRQMNDNDAQPITKSSKSEEKKDCPVFLYESTPLKPPLKESYSLPSQAVPLKLMFSYALSEEDTLLNLLVGQFSSTEAGAQLSPAYALCMCVEYGIMCYGPRAMTAFIKKTTTLVQNKAWDLCKKLSEWKIDTEKAKKPESMTKELFERLEGVLLVLANTMEFYYFLTTNCRSLNFSEHISTAKWSSSDQEQLGQGNQNILLHLYNVLVYIFQQVFYSVSKVLYHTLPVMFTGCTEDKVVGKSSPPIVIDQAVDFLQALLDLVSKIQVHLEVISQFFANIFFFTNAVMFNSLIEQGGDLALYQYNSGVAMRANLDLLEGWACQVGFRDSVLHYLAKFSGTMDFLSTPPNQLLEMDWCHLRKEYPMLHPAQLHFILSNYLLPVSHVPSHWTPTQEDALHVVKTGVLKESFDHHPSFELPTSGYVVDLTRCLDDVEYLQPYLDNLKKQLKTTKKSIDIVPVTENVSIKTYTSGVDSSEKTSAPSHSKPYKVRKLLINDSPVRVRRNIGSNTESQEDLLQDSKNRSNSDEYERKKSNPKLQKESDEISNYEKEKKVRKSGREKKVDRVHSIIAPRSYKTPEKFLLDPADENESAIANASWLEANFPLDAKTVTIPRGEKGFGFFMVEEKDPNSMNSCILVQEVLPGSIADKYSLVSRGDKILSIDGQLLDGADYIIADKYLREAEDDVTLVIQQKQRTRTRI